MLYLHNPAVMIQCLRLWTAKKSKKKCSDDIIKWNNNKNGKEGFKASKYA